MQRPLRQSSKDCTTSTSDLLFNSAMWNDFAIKSLVTESSFVSTYLKVLWSPLLLESSWSTVELGFEEKVHIRFFSPMSQCSINWYLLDTREHALHHVR